MQGQEDAENDVRGVQGDSDGEDTFEPPTISRRDVLKAGAGAGAAVTMTTSPVAAAPLSDDTDLTRYVAAHQGWFGTEFPVGDVVEYESGDAEWFVSYETGDSDAYDEWLADWITSTESRVELSQNASRGYVLVSAPTSEMVPDAIGMAGDELATRDGIESVEPVRELTNTEPLSDDDLITSGGWESPGSWFEQAVYGSVPATGSRFDETGPYTLTDVTNRAGFDDVTETGGGVTIAVIDTGLNYDASLFGDRVAAGKNTITGEEIDPSNDDYAAVADGNLHGSWVCTASAGNGSADTGTGAAPGASIIPIKALDDEGSGTTEDIVSGIEYAAENGADVINLSLGAPIRAQPIVDAISWALLDKGVTAVVTAAGNSRMTTHYMSSPAEQSETIPVASIDSEPASESLSAYYSSVAPHPDSEESMSVAAGGHRVSAEIQDGSELVDERLSGTSMASPVVTGLVAVVLEADSTLAGKPVEMRDRIEAAAEPLPKAGSTEVGSGRIDAPRAVAGDESDGDQSSARDSDAKSRDAMNQNIINTDWLI